MRNPTPAQLLLDAELSVDYPAKPGVLRGVRVQIRPGEIFGLIGQSGSGKSTFVLALLGLLDRAGARIRGHARFQDLDLVRASEARLRRLRGKDIALVLQSPLASLNPALRIGTQLREAWEAHACGSRGVWKERVLAVLASVSLPAEESFLRRYPRELSVGLAQRVLIAMAILHRPKLLIADEPTSALDVITQAEILTLFRQLNQDLGMSILLISHDLISVASLCHRIAILNQGELVETGLTRHVFEHPDHPYTRKLISALPTSGLLPLHFASSENAGPCPQPDALVSSEYAQADHLSRVRH